METTLDADEVEYQSPPSTSGDDKLHVSIELEA